MQDFLRQARRQIITTTKNDDVHGDILERLLSLLSTLPALNNSSNNNNNGCIDKSILQSIRHLLFYNQDKGSNHVNQDDDNNSNHSLSLGVLLSPDWIVGLTFLQESSILDTISGSELHAVIQTSWQVFLDHHDDDGAEQGQSRDQ